MMEKEKVINILEYLKSTLILKQAGFKKLCSAISMTKSIGVGTYIDLTGDTK